MTSGAHAARLASLTRELLVHWRETRDSWADTKAREFEERYLLGLEQVVNAAVPALEQIESTLCRIRSDCE